MVDEEAIVLSLAVMPVPSQSATPVHNPHIERLVPSIKGETAMEHLHRYAIARDLSGGKRVLDLACGEGFGAALLSQTADRVTGVDICEETIAAASAKYQRENLKFVVGSATDLPIASCSIDLVACFETIEHVADQEGILGEIKRVLKPAGLLIVSTPDKDQYNAPDLPPNPYHTRELSRDEFKQLLQRYFKNVELFGQRVAYASNVAEDSAATRSHVRYVSYRGDYYHADGEEGLARPRYLLALCSTADLPAMNVGIFEDPVDSELVVHSAREWLAKDEAEAKLQIFVSQNGSYDEHPCSTAAFPRNRWRRVRVDLPHGLGDGSAPLRFDPGNEIGVIQIARIQVRMATNQLIWRARGVAELAQLVVGGTAVVAPDERVFRILNYGVDPQVLLPRIDVASGLPLKLEIWLRLDIGPETVAEYFAALQSRQRTAFAKREAQLRETERQRAALENNLRSLEEQRLSLEVALDEHQAELAAHRSELERLEREVWENRVRRADFAARLKEREKWITELQESLVWKAAKPLWKAERHLSRRKAAKPEPAADEIVFALDGPGVWNARRNSVELTGWCFTRGGPQIVGVRAKIGRKSYFARYGLQRADVAKMAMTGPATLYSGFSLRIPVTPETSVIRLEAITHNGPWCLVLEHSLAGPAPPRHRSTSAPTIEPPPTERPDRPIHANGSQPVLYPNVSADEVLPLLGPHIQQHLARANVTKPIITVITPTFNTAPRWFVEAGASLLNQSFADWEWCLVDDGSQDLQTKRILESLAQAHPNIHVKLSSSKGISAAANEALEMTRGEFVCFLDHDDLLAPEALQAMYDKLSQGFDVVYSDEDKLDDNRRLLTEPFFKPDWSPEYFRGAMYVGHLLCLRRDLACRVRFDTNFDGVQDFEFMLRVGETGARIGHVPRILYHWRKTPGSIAETSAAKPQAAVLQEKAVNAHLQRVNLPAEARAGSAPHRLRIVPKPRSSSPKISIIVPTRDSPDLLARCLKSLFETTAYPNYEVILVDNDTGDAQALELMRHYPVTRIYLPNPFNFSRANNLAARRADGEYLVFLNNDTEVISPEWLDHLLYYAEQRDVGAVGALLLHDDGSVQHAGVILGMRGTADHSMRGFRAKSDGYAGSLSCAREVSAVTAACMAVRKSTFVEVGELNEHFFSIYQDLDFCLRLRERGLRIIWTPQAVLLHHESLSRQSYYDVVDRYLLLDQWEEVIQRGDPYYNRNLNVERGDYSLAPER